MPFNLGRLFSVQDQWAAARAAFDRALKIEPAHVEAWDGLGFAQEALGDDSAALASYRKAATLNEERKGSFATPNVNLSAFYNRSGDADAALEYARKAVAINEQADRGWFQMARAHERKGELDAAVLALNRAVSINPRASSYYYVLSTIYRRLGRQQDSREAMEAFSKLDRETNEIERTRREGLRGEAPRNE
jgi:tetratricopeptide (TPR) repeat protein